MQASSTPPSSQSFGPLTSVVEQSKEEEKDDFLRIDLTEEQKDDLKSKVQKLVTDCEEQAGDVLKKMKIPIANSTSKKHFELNQGMFKAFYEKRGDVVKAFLG